MYQSQIFISVYNDLNKHTPSYNNSIIYLSVLFYCYISYYPNGTLLTFHIKWQMWTTKKMYNAAVLQNFKNKLDNNWPFYIIWGWRLRKRYFKKSLSIICHYFY